MLEWSSRCEPGSRSTRKSLVLANQRQSFWLPCSRQVDTEGTAQCNEQDYRGRLAGIVWYQRKSSQRGTALPFFYSLPALSEWLSSLSCCQTLSLSISVFLSRRGPPTAAAADISEQAHLCVCLLQVHTCTLYIHTKGWAPDRKQGFCWDCCSRGNAFLNTVKMI